MHRGAFGGAAPDALIALLHALATLHNAHGNVAVAGLRRAPWLGASYTDEEFRAIAGVEPGMPLFGTGGLGARLWSGPAITVVGIDAPAVEEAVNAVVPYARAKLNLRVHPEQGAAEAQEALIRHLEAVRPFGIALSASPAGPAADGFAATTSGPTYQAAHAALHEAVPDAEILLFGPQDNSERAGDCRRADRYRRALRSASERPTSSTVSRTTRREPGSAVSSSTHQGPSPGSLKVSGSHQALMSRAPSATATVTARASGLLQSPASIGVPSGRSHWTSPGPKNRVRRRTGCSRRRRQSRATNSISSASAAAQSTQLMPLSWQ